MKKVELSRSFRPSFMKPRSSELDLPGADRGIGREKRIQDVAGGDAAADGEHRRPGEPIAPDRKRRDELGVAHPGGRAIDRCAARLVGKETGDLGIGEGLDKAEDDRQRPYQDRGRADGRGDAADGEEDERRDAARDPERILPTYDPVKLGLRSTFYVRSSSGVDHGSLRSDQGQALDSRGLFDRPTPDCNPQGKSQRAAIKG